MSNESGDEPDLTVVAVWRRIPPSHFPKKPRQDRANSSAFDDDPDGQPMSVVIADPSRDPSEVLEGHPGFGLVEISGDALRRAGQTIRRDPLSDEPDHAVIVGDKPAGVRRAIAKAAIWVVRPPEAYPPPD